MIPSIYAWRVVVSMRILMGVQRIVSVRAVALPNLIDNKSCEGERCTMRMGAAAQSCRWGAVVTSRFLCIMANGNAVHASLLARALIRDSCVFTW